MALKSRRTQKNKTNRRNQQNKKRKSLRKNTRKNLKKKRQSRRMRGGGRCCAGTQNCKGVREPPDYLTGGYAVWVCSVCGGTCYSS